MSKRRYVPRSALRSCCGGCRWSHHATLLLVWRHCQHGCSHGVQWQTYVYLPIHHFFQRFVIMPRPVTTLGAGEHYKMKRRVCLSVRPSVCRVPRPNSRMERRRKPKVGRMEEHHTSNPWTYLEVKRSKGKVIRPTNTETESVSYLPNRTAHEPQTWCTDGAREPVSSTSAMT